MDKEQAKELAIGLVMAVLDTIEECGDEGAPASSIYVALMAAGLSYETFQVMMNNLVATGKVRCYNHRYYATKRLIYHNDPGTSR